jgi:hypothetical protein
MNKKRIEELLAECQEMASEDAFNLDKGHIKLVDDKKYIDLLEGLIRMYFTKFGKKDQ